MGVVGYPRRWSEKPLPCSPKANGHTHSHSIQPTVWFQYAVDFIRILP